MGHFMFYLAVIAACLLWSATCIAAAARTKRTWLQRLLVAVAVLVPPLALAPWVGLTALLAFSARLHVNWFAPTVTVFVAAVIGGLWIRAAGLSRRPDEGGFVAASWPVVGLAAMFVMAKAVTFGTLLFIDNAVAAEGRALRVEAAQLLQANLPPRPAADNDAAPLYLRAFAALEAAQDTDDDTAGANDALLSKPLSVNVSAAEVTGFLARHAAALALVRRAADTPGCWFVRDWSRPSFDLLLPEMHQMRKGAALLAIAARREAAAGDSATALRDIVRLHRIAMHAAAEPVLVCGLVGQAIDRLALETLAAVLPVVQREDLPLFDEPAVRDSIATPLSFQRHLLGEEAFGLATLADLANGRTHLSVLAAMEGASTRESSFTKPLAVLYRCFMLPSDLASYKGFMRRYQRLIGSMAGTGPGASGDFITTVKEIESDIAVRRVGMFTALMTPALSGVVKTQAKGDALHRVADVLVAATRERLVMGAIPETLEALVPGGLPAVPRDPFTDGKPLIANRAGDAWVVYSVGPDGEDDGGPPAAGVQPPEGNDDVGLRLQVSAGTPTDAP
jgi:hypothetical protein